MTQYLDFVSERGFEMPSQVAGQAYATQRAIRSREFGFQVERAFSETTGKIIGGAERGAYEGSSLWDRMGAIIGQANAGMPIEQPIETPMLSADEANKRYAPPGTKITDTPMRAALARMAGRDKARAQERDNVLARYEAQAPWYDQFASGVVAQVMDPLTLSTMFLPGIGEEAILSRLATVGFGRSAASKFLARGLAGAGTGAIAQAPLSALRYAAGDGDYDLRSAFRDMAFAAAGGAVLHAGFGALGDMLRPTPDAPLTPTPRLDAASTMDVMRAGISQVVEGRPLDVMPVIDAARIRTLSREAGLRREAESISGQLLALPKSQAEKDALDTLQKLETVERNLKDEGLSKQQRKALLDRRDEILEGTTPDTLRAQAATARTRQQLEGRRGVIERELASSREARARMEVTNLAENQRRLYEAGFVPGIPQRDFEALRNAIYGPLDKFGQEAPRAAAEGEAAAAAAPEGGPQGGPAAGPKPPEQMKAEADPPAEADAAAPLETQLKALARKFLGEDAEKVDPQTLDETGDVARTMERVEQADTMEAAYQQAAECLTAEAAGLAPTPAEGEA